MQHRLGHDCALCDAHSKAAERHTARPHVRTKRYLPWIAPLALCVVLIPFVDGAARGLFAGIVVGLAAGAGYALFQFARQLCPRRWRKTNCSGFAC